MSRTLSVFAAIVVVSGLSAPMARAQRAGVVSGTVYDSLITRAPLPDAEVVLVGVGRSAITDARGRFRIDSVPAGRHQITFYHPVLDSLSLGAGLFPLAVP